MNNTRQYAIIVHRNAGCTYGVNDEPYEKHLDMVYRWVLKYTHIFKSNDDFENVCAAAYTHDVIEDAQQTYNNVKDVTNTDIADITLAVTDIHEKNRMLRFLSTAPKILKDYRALILKICDIAANASYGKSERSSMYKKYQSEWKYKRFIFITAAKWYPNELDLNKFAELIQDVDKVMEYNA